jgi:hypothetical protein
MKNNISLAACLLLITAIISSYAFAGINIDISKSTTTIVDDSTFKLTNVTAGVDGVTIPGKYWINFTWDPVNFVFMPLHFGEVVDIGIDIDELVIATVDGSPDISALKEKAAEKGEVNVIVGLKLPDPGFQPEGTLPGPEAVEKQRKAIASKRQELLGSLQGYNAKLYGSWDALPYVALKVDASALNHLANSPLVTTIQEDALSKPTLDTPALIK